MQSNEVLESLSNIKGQVEAHLRNVKEYRAFLAIQAAMDEISHIAELVSPLESVKDGVRQRLNDLREYRAMLAVEKSITDIANVLGLLDEIAPRPAHQGFTAEPAPSATVAADVNDQQQSASAQTEPAAQSAEVTIAIAASKGVAAPALADNAPAPQPVEVSIVTTPAQAIAGTAPIDFAAAQREDVPLAAAVATHAPVASDAVVTGIEQEVDTMGLALGASSVPTTEHPVPSASPESKPESEALGIVSGQAQEEPAQAMQEHDPAIAKVA